MPFHHGEDYKTQYKALKRKIKILIYENECFQDELRKSQRALLRIQRDKSFLLDRILQYQKGPDSTSDSDQTEDSDNEPDGKDNKRKKMHNESTPYSMAVQSNTKANTMKKKRPNQSSNGNTVTAKHSSSFKINRGNGNIQSGALNNAMATVVNDGPMSREEIERHLAARQPIPDFSTTISLTLPNQLFSDNIPEGDCVEEDVETSPSNLDDEVTVDSYD